MAGIFTSGVTELCRWSTLCCACKQKLRMQKRRNSQQSRVKAPHAATQQFSSSADTAGMCAGAVQSTSVCIGPRNNGTFVCVCFQEILGGGVLGVSGGGCGLGARLPSDAAARHAQEATSKDEGLPVSIRSLCPSRAANLAICTYHQEPISTNTKIVGSNVPIQGGSPVSMCLFKEALPFLFQEVPLHPSNEDTFIAGALLRLTSVSTCTGRLVSTHTVSVVGDLPHAAGARGGAERCAESRPHRLPYLRLCSSLRVRRNTHPWS